MITIYAHGCTTCGNTGAQIRRVKRAAKLNDRSVEVIDTKTQPKYLPIHVQLAQQLGARNTDQYTPVVKDGTRVMRLDEWTL